MNYSVLLIYLNPYKDFMFCMSYFIYNLSDRLVGSGGGGRKEEGFAKKSNSRPTAKIVAAKKALG